jgi:hypothetical protein
MAGDVVEIDKGGPKSYCGVAPYCSQVGMLANHDARVRLLEEGRAENTRTLQRIEDKLEGLVKWMMGALLSSLVCLAGSLLAFLLKK